jgi:hypothetical protein
MRVRVVQTPVQTSLLVNPTPGYRNLQPSPNLSA